MNNNKKALTTAQQIALLSTLETRFNKNMQLHKGIEWVKVKEKLLADKSKIWSLNEMEESGGEPDVVVFDKKNSEFTFVDCSPETPKERRSICYDHEALESRKANKPADSAVQMAAGMGITLLNEEQYRALQTLGNFDTKTSSWILTPPAIRKLGGALFCDRRFDHVFLYHNGAESYYAGRGFRGLLIV